MKKLFSAILCVVSLNAFSQASKWFVSVSAGGTVLGPSATIKSQMKKQGYDDTGSSNFFGFTNTTDYPKKTQELSLLVTVGKKLTDHGTIYVTAGQLDKSEIRGFKNLGFSSSLWGLVSGDGGPMPMIKYNVGQVTVGYMYSSSKNRVKIGAGPSVFLVNYSSGMDYQYGETNHSVVPGISTIIRLPLGKERKMFGFEMMIESNLAPNVKMETSDGPAKDQFKMKSANMVSFNFGLAVRLQKPASKS